MFVPKGTPAPVVAKLNKAITEVMRQDDVKQKLTDLGVEPVGSTPEVFSTFLKEEATKWGQVIKASNIKLD